MAGVDNLVLEQLRLIREDLGRMRAEMGELRSEVRSDIAGLRDEMMSQRTVLIGLGTYIGAINKRVEHVGAHLRIAP